MQCSSGSGDSEARSSAGAMLLPMLACSTMLLLALMLHGVGLALAPRPSSSCWAPESPDGTSVTEAHAACATATMVGSCDAKGSRMSAVGGGGPGGKGAAARAEAAVAAVQPDWVDITAWAAGPALVLASSCTCGRA
jgi:hypothetical protein